MRNFIQRKKPFRLLIIFLLFPFCSFAQSTTVSGTITGQSGEALIGVSIVETGTPRGTVSDIDGKYSIEVSSNAKLTFSYISYQTVTVDVKGQKVINVVLKEDAKALSEVVVIGYGKMKRTDLTGAITSVSGDAIGKSVVTSIDQILQGRAAGVQVQQNSGIPGGSTSIRIRGTSSINSSNEPIYVIDGVMIDGQTGSNDNNPLASINPEDIVSLDILKDASATAIFGSRAANGVIMISTKRGKSGDSRVTYNSYVGWQEMPKKLALLNLQEYATQRNAISAAAIYSTTNSFIRPDLLGPGTDWQDELFSKALMTNHNLSISGGSDKTTYVIGAGWLQQNGIAVGSGFKRYNFRANVETQVKSWLKSGIDLNFSDTNQKLTVSDESLIKIAWKQTPNVPVRNVDGEFGGPETAEGMQSNPLALALIKENYAENANVRGNVFLEATILKDLSYRTEFSFNTGMNNTYKFTPTYTFGAISNDLSGTASERTKSFSQFWAFRNLLTYNKVFNVVHSLNLMLGQEAQKSGWEYLAGYRSGYISNVAHDLNIGDAATATNGGNSGGNSLLSYFGRLFYSYDDRYLLTATLRHDGSSNFARGHQWGWFPSTALAWKISNEDFLKDHPVIYNLKLRLGWGEVGNQNIPAYAYTSVLGGNATASWGTGLLMNNTANPNLVWEKTSSSNLGVDLGLFKGRIDLTLDFYYKKTDNLLLQVPLPAYVGTSGTGAPDSPWANIGSLQNKGFEISLNTVNINLRDFSWKSNVVFSLNRNKVLSLNYGNPVDGRISEGSDQLAVITRTVVGQPVGEFYGYKVIGRFESASDFYYRGADGTVKPVPLPDKVNIGSGGAWIGDYIFKDVDNSGCIDSGDRVPIGNPEPKFTYGFTNNFTYKNVDLSISLNGVYGNKVVNYQRRWLDNPAATTNLFNRALNYAVLSKIDPAGPDNDYRNLYISSGDPFACRMTTGSSQAWNNIFSDRFIEDGSYLRIQSVSIGYHLPGSIIHKIGIENVKIYANLQNVFTFTKYSGYDPEIGAIGQSALLSGIDNARYPAPRIFTFGLNLTF